MSARPQLSFSQIWNMCFGFLGIQMGFALQNSNVSRIFQTLGADVEDLAILWIAAPLTGLLVQPIIGYMSDRTWTRFGRRRPYFTVGAVLSIIALCAMPHSPYLWVAAGMLWIMDASINIAMEPFRAYVGDNLPVNQRSLGYGVQSFFIAVGAVIASALPYLMTNYLDIANTAPEGQIPDSVRYSFYIGGTMLFLTVMWTVVSTKEYSPEELAAFDDTLSEAGMGLDDQSVSKSANFLNHSLVWLIGSLVVTLVIFYFGHHNPDAHRLYILTGCGAGYGVLLLLAHGMKVRGDMHNAIFDIVTDLFAMPSTMRQLAVVQFFSWFALFTMWTYTTVAVTSYHYGTTDTLSKIYNDGADWVGVLFGGYNVFAAIAAFIIPMLARNFSMQKAHSICLALGALGYLSMLLIKDPQLLMISMIGIGFAWAAIISLPYAMLSTSIPGTKMGVYMGIFNFFIVIPQMLASIVLGFIVKLFFDGEAIYMMIVAAVFMLIASALALRVKTPHDND